jgi:hypothetical protein
MPWESRGKARYYYRSEWSVGRSVRRYAGCGPVGLLAEQIDEQARERREARAKVLRDEAARLEGPEAAIGALNAACGLVVRAALTAAGFHRLDYSAWRRRRARSES